MRILGIHHVFIPCTAIEQARSFYVDVLGLSVDPSGPRTADPGPGSWLDVVPGQQVHMKENATEWHVSFEVEDLGDAIETLNAHGIDVSPPSLNPSAGVRQSAFRDPSGMLLEIFERVS